MNDEVARESYLDGENSWPDKPGQGHEATHDAVFGTLNEDGPNYRSVRRTSRPTQVHVAPANDYQVGWLGTTALMLKTNLGLGVLSIPAVFDSLGMIPGIICVLVIAGITGWSQYMIGVFKIRHPEVYGIEDVGGMLFGPIAKELIGAGFFICELHLPDCTKD